jgi:hypothetical protein
MRSNLANYVNQLINCKGYIKDFALLDNKEIRQITLSNVVIKKADKNLSFAEQTLISKEDHLNLFLDKQEISCSRGERYEVVYIMGYIKRYTRKDGSLDYGVRPVEHTDFNENFKDLIERAVIAERNGIINETNLKTLMQLRGELTLVDAKIDKVGDLLPTFGMTYKEHKDAIKEMKEVFDKRIKYITSICLNRSMRRAHKVKRNFLLDMVV